MPVDRRAELEALLQMMPTDPRIAAMERIQQQLRGNMADTPLTQMLDPRNQETDAPGPSKSLRDLPSDLPQVMPWEGDEGWMQDEWTRAQPFKGGVRPGGRTYTKEPPEYNR